MHEVFCLCPVRSVKCVGDQQVPRNPPTPSRWRPKWGRATLPPRKTKPEDWPPSDQQTTAMHPIPTIPAASTQPAARSSTKAIAIRTAASCLKSYAAMTETLQNIRHPHSGSTSVVPRIGEEPRARVFMPIPAPRCPWVDVGDPATAAVPHPEPDPRVVAPPAPKKSGEKGQRAQPLHYWLFLELLTPAARVRCRTHRLALAPRKPEWPNQ